MLKREILYGFKGDDLMMKRKLLSVVTSAIMAVTALAGVLPRLTTISTADAVYVSTNYPALTGDVNKDGKLNTADFLLLQK